MDEKKKRRKSIEISIEIQKDFCRTITSTEGEERERKQKAGKNRGETGLQDTIFPLSHSLASAGDGALPPSLSNLFSAWFLSWILLNSRRKYRGRTGKDGVSINELR